MVNQERPKTPSSIALKSKTWFIKAEQNFDIYKKNQMLVTKMMKVNLSQSILKDNGMISYRLIASEAVIVEKSAIYRFPE